MPLKDDSNNNIQDNLRIVTANPYLIVRERGKKNSKRVGRLYPEEYVRLLIKGKKWSLVEQRNDATGVTIRGWVYSNHLKEIN